MYLKLTLLLFLFSSYSQLSTEYEYIPIINLDRKPIIEGVLNGEKAYFLVDTGSDLSFLNVKEEEFFGFHPKKKFKSLYLTGMGGRVNQIAQVTDAKLVLGSQFIYTAYMSCDLTDITDSIEKTTGIHIHGIIGSDVMRNYFFKIDYETKEIGIAIRQHSKMSPQLISKDVSNVDIW